MIKTKAKMYKLVAVSLLALFGWIFVNGAPHQAFALNQVADWSFTNNTSWTWENASSTDTCTATTQTKAGTVLATFARDSTGSVSSKSVDNVRSSTGVYRGNLYESHVATGTASQNYRGKFSFSSSGNSWDASGNSFVRLDLYTDKNGTYVGTLGCQTFTANTATTTVTTGQPIVLTGGTKYTIRVSTVIKGNNGNPTLNNIWVDNIVVTAPPMNMAVSLNGSNQPALTWNVSTASTSANTASTSEPYAVYRATSSGGEARYATTTTNSYTDTSFTGNTTYYYWVTNLDTSAYESASSTEVSVLTKPGAPTSVTASNITEAGADISWTAPTGGAASYKVERCTGSGCNSSFTELATGVSSPYTDSTGSAGTTYVYRVRATNASGDGSYSSNSSDVTTTTVTDPASATVVAYDATNTLAWVNPATNYTKTLVLRRASSAVTDAPTNGVSYSTSTAIGSSVVVCSGNMTTCNETGLTNGTAYHYKMFTRSTLGNYSTGVVPSGSPATPGMVTVTQQSYQWYASTTAAGTSWTSRTSAADVAWLDVAFGNGVFVVISGSGSDFGNNETTETMSSSDGVSWTTHSAPVIRYWNSVAFGNGIFVATAVNGCSTNCVMTSTDGTTWTGHEASVVGTWRVVAYGAGTFVAISENSTNAMTSTDGINWTTRTTAASKSWRGLAYGNGLFVATSISGTTNDVMTSPDGITWTLRTVPTATGWSDVTYGDGLFVAVNGGGTANTSVMTSPDGINWTTRTASSGSSWTKVTYGGGLFVAVSSTAGTSNQVMTSSDGITWNAGTSGVDRSWQAVGYGNGMFVAAASSGTGNRVMTSGSISGSLASQDTSFTMTYPTQAVRLKSLLRIDSASLALTGTSSKLQYAVKSGTCDTGFSGESYADVTSSTNLAFYDGPGNDGDGLSAESDLTDSTRIIVNETYEEGNNFSNSQSTISSGQDGKWEFSLYDNTATSSTSYCLRVVKSGGTNWNTYTSIPEITTAAASTTIADGTDPGSSTIAPGASATEIDRFTLKVNRGNDYLTGLTAQILPSTATTVTSKIDIQTAGGTSQCYVGADGTAWSAQTSAEDNTWAGIAYGNNTFVAVANDGTHRVMTSPDGVTWTARTAAEQNTWMAVGFGNGTFVATSNDGTHRVMTSPDGITWTAQTAASVQTWQTIAYGNGLFVSGNNDGGMMSSPDGVTWTSRTGGGVTNLASSAYGNGMFVTVASGGVISSPDGITWTSRTIPSGFWTSVTYGGGQFVAVATSGGSNQVATSPDGITWTARTPATTNAWQSVTYGNGLYIAVSNTGSLDRVMTSPDGITWTSRTTNDNAWKRAAFGGTVFAAVSANGSSNRVMTSGSMISSNNVSLTSCNLWLTTSAVEYKIMVTPKTHDDMPAPAGASYGVTANVTGWTGVNTIKNGTDTAGATITIDNASPSNVTSASGSVGDTYVGLSWTNPGDADLSTIIVARSTSAINSVPAEGSTYSTSTVTNGSTIVCSGLQTSCNDTGLTNSTAYNYKIFAQDTRGNWSNGGTTPTGSPVTPLAASYTQQAYRLFDTGGTALAAQDTAATLTSTGEAFKIKALLRVDTASILASSPTFKLQFATSSGACDTGFSGETYEDVTTTSNMAYYDGTGNDGDLISALSDLTDGGRTVVNQTYEEANNFTNSQGAITSGQDGKWEFSVYDKGGVSATAYCFRIVKSTGTTINTYTVIPQVTTLAGQPGITQLHYRWRNDDGSETSATNAAGQDSALTDGVFLGDRRRLRISLSSTGAATAANYTYRLEYASSSCSTWYTVPDYGSTALLEWVMDLAQVANGGSTSDYAGLSNPASKTFVAGQTRTQTNQASAFDLATDKFTEMEYSIKSTPYVIPNVTYCFRTTNGGSTSSFTYTVQPQITVKNAQNNRPGQGGGTIENSGNGNNIQGGNNPGGGGSGSGSGSGAGGESGGGGGSVGGGGQGGGGGGGGGVE